MDRLLAPLVEALKARNEFELTDLGSTEIDYVNVCHRSSLFALAIDAASQNFV